MGSIPATKEIADTINPLINALPDGPYPNLPIPEDGKTIGKFILAAEGDFGNQPPFTISLTLGGESTRSMQWLLPDSDARAISGGTPRIAADGTEGREGTEASPPGG